MSEIITTMTERGQVTVPAQVRKMLRLKRGDKIAFRIDGDRVEIAPASFTLESVFGSVEPTGQEHDLEKMIRDARDAKASKDLRKLKL